MVIFNLFRLTAVSLSLLFSYFYSNSISEMSVEEKVGQLLMVHFRGEEVNEDAIKLVQDTHVGGIIYYNWANGLNSPEQVKKLSMGLQKLAKKNRFPIPLLIAVDQEGGVVNRLTKGFTLFPGNKAIGMTGDLRLSELSAFAMGQELRAVGVNMNLSPVVDVNNNFLSSVIGIRAFSNTADRVIAYAESTLAGYSRAGLISSLKHYPGHGDVSVDSHVDLPELNKTKEQLKKLELLPFKALASQADMIMTAHLMVPSFDAENCATLSKVTLDYLRDEIGFQGVIISDSLVMEGLLKNCDSIDAAAIRALNAGCDILLLGGKQMVGSDLNLELTADDVQRIHRSIVAAVKSGKISKERLDCAVTKVLELKKRYEIPIALAMNHDDEDRVFINIAKHHSIAQKTASMSLRKIKNRELPKLNQSTMVVFAPMLVKENIKQTDLLQLGKKTTSLFYEGLNPTQEEIEKTERLANDAEILVFCSYNASHNNGQAALIERLCNYQKPMVIIALRDPFDATLFPDVDQILMTFSPTSHSIQAAADELKN